MTVAMNDVATPAAVSAAAGLGRLWLGLWSLFLCRGGIRCRDCRRGSGSLLVNLCRVS